MKRFYQVSFVFLISIFSFSGNLQATHISGGDISYKCIGQDSFLVTLKLFRDCAGITVGTTAAINAVSSCGGNISAVLTQQTFSEVSALCPTQLSNSTCNGGTLPGLQEFVYSGVVVLSPACNSWTLYWSSCCRNAQVVNLNNPGSLGTYLYSTLNSMVDSCNSSPTFESQPVPYVCQSQLANINMGAVDLDGDSLVYFLSPGFVGATSLVAYANGYSYLQPISGSNLVLNSTTGQLTFTPSLIGVYVVTVRVEEYDRLTGVLKGNIIRDFQIVSFSCGTNLAPVIDTGGIYNATNNSRIDSNHIGVCAGDSFSFDIALSDLDTSQTVSITHSLSQTFGTNAVGTITSGNPSVLHVSGLATMNLLGDNTFYVQGMDGACPIPATVSGVFHLIVQNSTYAGIDRGICAGSQWTGLTAVGGNSFVWSVISGSTIDAIATSPNYNMSCKSCGSALVSPQTTTTYQLLSNVSGACSNLDTVVVTVAPDFVLTMPADDIICPSNNVVLTSSVSQPTFTYTYKWSHGNSLNFDSILSPTASPANPTSYRLKASSGVCVKKGTVFIDVKTVIPNLISVSGDSVVCSGESVTLQTNIGNVFVDSCEANSDMYIGNKGIAIIQPQFNNVGYRELPYSGAYKSNKYQMLYTAAELVAAGMTSGPIYSLSMNVSSNPSSSYQNFEIKMGCTANLDMSSGWENNLETVVASITHTPTQGWNKLTFSSPYLWDGTSNLVVQVCYSNTAVVATPTVEYSNTTNRTRYFNSNYGSACAVTTGGTISNWRINMKFDYYSGPNVNNLSYSWTPTTGMTNSSIPNPSITVNTPTTYTLVVQDLAGSCTDTVTHFIDAVNSFDAGFTQGGPYCLNDDADTLLTNVGGGIFTGTGVSGTGVFTPSLAGVGSWPINYNIPTPVNCANDSTINIRVLALPDASFPDKEFCLQSAPDSLSPVISGGVWSGTGIIDTANGIFSPIGLPAGDYSITHSVSTGCNNSYTGIVKIIEPYTFVFNSYVKSICENGSVDLSTNVTMSSHPLQGNGVVVHTWYDAGGYTDSNGVFDAIGLPSGDYVVRLSVADEDGNCGSSQDMIVRVNPIDFASLLETEFCESSTDAKIFVNPWLFGTGITYKQTPLSPLQPIDTLDISPFGQNGMFDPSVQGAGQWEFELTYQNIYGCIGTVLDTIFVLDSPIGTVTSDGRTLISDAEGPYDFQWFDCDNNQAIPGAISRNFLSVKKGMYKVKVSVGSCTVTSNCIETWPVGVSEVKNPFEISLYPNPTENELSIDMGDNSYLDIEILDNSGKVVISTKVTSKVVSIDVSNLASGVYLVKMKGAQGEQTKKIIKK